MNWLEHTRLHVLKLNDLNLEDTLYWIPHFADPDRLKKSIEKIGILNRPVVKESSPGAFIPVLGRRRLEAVRGLGYEQAEVLILPGDMPVSSGWRLAFWDNVAHRNFEPATTAVIVNRLLEIFPKDEVAGEFLPVLGVPARGPRLERLRLLGSLEHRVLHRWADGRLLEKTALLLAQLDRPNRAKLMDVVEALNLNANKSAEVVGNLFDLSVYHGMSISEILLHETARSILSDDEVTIEERAARFRDMVRSKKFPDLVEKEREFQNWCQRFHGLSNVKIRPTQSFEADGCYVEVRVSNREEAERMLEVLQR